MDESEGMINQVSKKRGLVRNNHLSLSSKVMGLGVTVCATLTLLAATATSLTAQTVDFEAMPVKGGKKSSSSCVLIDSKGILATVIQVGADPQKAVLQLDGESLPLIRLAYDVHSRVGIFKLPEGQGSGLKLAAMGDSSTLAVADALTASAAQGNSGDKARLLGRVSEFQGHVLPVAVLQVNHPQAAPMPGSAMYNSRGELVALVRQVVQGNTRSSYCLPSEVITRIVKDYQKHQMVRRCWIGIVMDELVAPPIVESVRPNSPAQKAGLQNGDLIIRIGSRQVSNYAEVVDAFYYMIGGESENFQVLRGTKIMEISVVPEVTPSR